MAWVSKNPIKFPPLEQTVVINLIFFGIYQSKYQIIIA